ncbi:MAG: NYN domain-containing protein [Bacteroidales bacterium]|jgi:uncharacterized LabA/DUF88 family protein
MSDKQKIIFYIDGFNFYYGLKSQNWKKYYWIDIVKFCQSFIRPHQELIEVNYFSAIPTGNKGKQERQDLFFSVNKQNPLFKLHLGKYLSKKIHCKNFKYDEHCKNCDGFVYTFEEKETDVRLATQMIRDCVKKRCDISVLISADSDLIPPIEFIRENNTEFSKNHKIFVFFPPKRFSYNLHSLADFSLKLETVKKRFELAILPDEVVLKNKYVLKRPDKWK